ncbi:MAG: glycosyltransferase [Thermodesulfobacteriota bacterium]
MEKEELLFSIIIPTYNRPKEIATCLDSLTGLNYSREKFEAIIVDDGSTLPIDEVIDRFSERLNISLIRKTNNGPASARNKGASMASGKFLAFTDDDCKPDPNWLAGLEDCLSKNSDCIVGGKTLNLLNDNLYSSASQMICELSYNHYNLNHEEASFFCTNNMAVPKARFLKIGGFDESFKTAEDRDFCNRWKNYGFNMIYCPKAIIYHAHELTLTGFIKQHFNYGRGSYGYYNKKSLHGPGYFRNLIKFNLNPKNLFIYPFSKYKGFKGISVVSLILTWQLINALGFTCEFLSRKINHNRNFTETR